MATDRYPNPVTPPPQDDETVWDYFTDHHFPCSECGDAYQHAHEIIDAESGEAFCPRCAALLGITTANAD